MFCRRFQPLAVYGAARDPVLQVRRAPARAAEGSPDRTSRHDWINLLNAGNHRREVRY